jgi:hypothetical protein
LETELESLNDKAIYPVLLLITLSVFTGSIFTPAAWDTIGTQSLYLKTDSGKQLVNSGLQKNETNMGYSLRQEVWD